MWPRCATGFASLAASDVMFNPLPVFHCFGLTGGTILPLMAGTEGWFAIHRRWQPKEIVRVHQEARAPPSF